MASHYVFRHIPSNVFVTIRADWSKVGDPEYVLDDIKEIADGECPKKEMFEIVGCFSEDDYDDKWKTRVDGPVADKLPDGWQYDIYWPSYERLVPTGHIENLKPIPEREVDRNEFKRKGLM